MNPGSTISSVAEGKLTGGHEVPLLILHLPPRPETSASRPLCEQQPAEGATFLTLERLLEDRTLQGNWFRSRFDSGN